MSSPTVSFSRRAFLVGGSGAAALSVFGFPTIARADGDPFGQILDNWSDYALGTNINPSVDVIRAAIDSLDARVATYLPLLSDAEDAVFEDLVLVNDGSVSDSGHPATSFLRLREMAEAYNTPGSTYEGSAELRDIVVAGTMKVHERVYHAGQPPFGNWWFWEVGSAQRVLSICALMGTAVMGADLVDGVVAAIDHFIRDEVVENRLASARMHACQSIFLRGALGRSTERIEYARTKLLEAFTYVDYGRGFYVDGSLVDHDNIAYTGTYGAVFMRGFVINAALVSRTPWALGSDSVQFGMDLVDKAFSPVLYDGLVFDNVRGRAIGRWNADSRDDGHALVAVIAQFSDTLDGPARGELRSRVRGWMERDPGIDPRLAEPDASVSRSFSEVVSLHGIWSDPLVTGAPEPVGTTIFGGMARAVHRQAGWAATISMSSDRIAHYEGYLENLRGWHTGSGMLNLHDSDSTQYTDNYWPTVDPYHLPGTTVDQMTLVDGQNGDDNNKDLSRFAWAGGALLGQHGAAVGLKLDGFSSSLTAKKSWFLISDRIVCLGSNIDKASDQLTIAPVADSHVVSGESADDNFGDVQTMYLKEGTTEAYIRFSTVEGLEDDQSTTELSVRAYVETPGATAAVIAVHAVTTPWEESDVTWNTKPAIGEKLGTFTAIRNRRYHSLDVSDYARARARDGQPVDVAIVVERTNPADGNVEVTFHSRDPIRTQPYLSVTRPGTTSVHTTLENRIDHAGDHRTVVVDGEGAPQALFEREQTGPHWIHLEDVGGYVWLEGDGPVRVARKSSTGRWIDINRNGGAPEEDITREYVSIVADHGVGPTGAHYAYAMLPNATRDETEEFFSDLPVDVISNDAAQHAVTVDGVTGANFWEPGTVGPVTVDSACAVVFTRRRGDLLMAVSRPDFTTDPVEVIVRGRGYSGSSFDDGDVHPVEFGRGTTMVTVPIKELGQTTRVRLHRR